MRVSRFKAALAVTLLALAGLANAQQLAVVNSGPALYLVDTSGGSLSILDSATIPPAEVLQIHQIFHVVQHPTNGMIYASSNNPCFDGTIGCWGNGRVDKFQVSGSTISYVGPAYIMNNDAFLNDGISCAQGTEMDTGYPGQEGFCAPTRMAFSPDGSRLYIDDDELDGIEIFSVDPGTGDLSFLAEGGSTSYHGLLFQNDRLYLGNSVFSVAGDAVTGVLDDEYGNGNVLLPSGAMMTALNNNAIAAYSLANPDAPAEIDLLNIGGGTAVDIAGTADGSLWVLGGRDVLTTVSWDGATLTQLDQVTTPTTQRAHRDVAIIEAGGAIYALVAHFTPEVDADYGTNATGAQLWSIDPGTGALTQVSDLPLADGWSRAALPVSGVVLPAAETVPTLSVAGIAVLALILAALAVFAGRARFGRNG
ncbi:hypothetical protein [Halomonas denitrificans]|nr:hypothetical protein [Halomonas denitrificans]